VSVAGGLGNDSAEDGPAEERQIADDIQDLVAGAFVVESADVIDQRSVVAKDEQVSSGVSSADADRLQGGYFSG
jgi:hypothetical protein